MDLCSITSAGITRPVGRTRPALSWSGGRRKDLRDPHLRVPDERARLRARRRAARRRRVREGRRRRDPRPGGVQHLRGQGKRGRPAVRQPRSPVPGQEVARGHADRRRRLPGADGARADHPACPLGGRRLRHPQHRGAAPPARAGAAAAGGAGRIRGDPRHLPEPAAGPPPVPVLGVGVDLGRLQQHLHVLHRPVAARAGEGPPPRRHPRGDHRAGQRRGHRGHPARAERELLRRGVRRPAGVRQAAARLRPGRGAGAGPVHLAAPAGLHRRRDRGDGGDAHRDAEPAHAAAVRLGHRAEGDAPRLPPRPLPGDPGQRAARDPARGHHHRHHRGFPRRDGGRLRRHPRRGPAGQVRVRVHVPLLDSSRHAGRDHGRPGAGGRRAGPVRPARRAGRGGRHGGERALRRHDRGGPGGRGGGPQGRRDAPHVGPGAGQPPRALRPRTGLGRGLATSSPPR